MITIKEVREMGIDNGLNAALNIEVATEDQEYCECGFGEACTGCLSTAAFAGEENARQYSPFEFFAHDINESANGERLWEVYDEGVAIGVRRGTKERLAA